MKLNLIWLFILLISCVAIGQSENEVKIIVLSDSVPEDSTVYITGNHSEIGNWQAAGKALISKGLNEWYCYLKLPDDFHLEYKFTLGYWEMEALDREGNIPSNNKLIITGDTTIIVSILSWWGRTNLIVSGQITGRVEYHHNLKGQGLRERDAIIWLPPKYFDNTNERYPVLYMHDGQNMFDPSTSAFGVDWQIDEAADTLIRKNYIKPIIIVGIYNTTERSNEYSDNETGQAYMNFIIHQLKPFIDSTYRTLPEKEFTATGGSSLGGLISFILLWEYPNVFHQAASLSPAFKIRSYDYVTPVESYNGEKKQIRIYIDNGGKGVDDSLQAGVDEMLGVLKFKGYTEGLDLYWYKAWDAEHSEKDWAKRVWRPLVYMFGNDNSLKYLQQ